MLLGVDALPLYSFHDRVFLMWVRIWMYRSRSYFRKVSINHIVEGCRTLIPPVLNFFHSAETVRVGNSIYTPSRLCPVDHSDSFVWFCHWDRKPCITVSSTCGNLIDSSFPNRIASTRDSPSATVREGKNHDFLGWILFSFLILFNDFLWFFMF